MTNQEKMELAVRRLARQVASEMVRAMGATDVSPEQIEDRLEVGRGYMRDKLLALIDGKGRAVSLHLLGEIGWALGCEPILALYQVEAESAGEEAPATSPAESVETPTG